MRCLMKRMRETSFAACWGPFEAFKLCCCLFWLLANGLASLLGLVIMLRLFSEALCGCLA